MIVTSAFAGEKIDLYFDNDELPEGGYDLTLYLSEHLDEVGMVQNRLAADGPHPVALGYDSVVAAYCLDRIPLGDSVYFRADSLPSFFEPKGYFWDVKFDSSIFDTGSFHINDVIGNEDDKFVKLGNNLFFPLKMSQLSAAGQDSIKWELTFIRSRPDSSDTVKVELIVYPPDRLGDSHNQYDDLIILWSDYFAMPPQIVKAIVDVESDFLNQAFRYEMRFDYSLFQPAMHNNTNYELYLLADSGRTGSPVGFDFRGDTVLQGDSVPVLEHDPYFVLSGWSLNPPVVVVDDNQDSLISACELAAHNNRFNRPPPSDSDFVAQIITSSSYGLMQPLQITLIDYCSFGARNPQVLLEEPDRAMMWGTKNLSDIYEEDVDTTYDWSTRWRTAIGKYNGGRGAVENFGIFDLQRINDYIEDVWQQVDAYQPEMIDKSRR